MSIEQELKTASCLLRFSYAICLHKNQLHILGLTGTEITKI